MNKPSSWQPGDWAIYIKQKRSVSPGPRARDVMPASAGDTYSYLVEKCWVVVEVLEGNRIRLITRRGKIHTVDTSDPRLRRPTFWQRLVLGSRFRQIAKAWRNNPNTEKVPDSE